MATDFGDIYDTGTISITNGATTATFVDTLLTTEAQSGDLVLINGLLAYVDSVTDDTHLEFRKPWPGTTVSGGSYVLMKMSKDRYDPAATQDKVRQLLTFYEAISFFYFVSGSAPDPGVGTEGQWALKVNAGSPWQLWYYTGGVWVEQDASPVTPSATVMHFTNTTEATGVGTTYAARFEGGVEIAKKLFVDGTASFSNTTEATGAGTTASVLFAGGIEIAKKLFVGGSASFTDTTEATGAGTTASVLFAGGVEIAKKLYVVGAVSLASTLAIAGVTSLTNTLSVVANSASAFIAGLTSGNPALTIDTSTVSSVTGLRIKSAAAAAGLALAVLSSGTNENLAIDAKGSGTITLNGIATGNIVTSRVATFTNATASTSTTSGSVTVGGGIGIAGAMNSVTAQIWAASNTGLKITSTNGTTFVGLFYNATDNQLTVGTQTNHPVRFFTNNTDRGGFALGGAFDTVGAANIAGILTVSNATSASSTTTGALVVSGGVGIAGNLRVGLVGGSAVFGPGGTGVAPAAVIYAAGSGTASGAYFAYSKNSVVDWIMGHRSGVLSSGTSNNFLMYMNGLGNAFEIDASTLVVNIYSTTVSTSTTTGALVVAGGTGIAGQLTVGGDANFAGSANPFLKFTPTSGATKTGRIQQSADILKFSAIGVADWVTIDLANGNLLGTGSILSNHVTAGIGYATGAGGTATAQATDKSTAVTHNKITGTVTMNAASLASNTAVSFTLNNSAIAATDFIDIQHESVGTIGAYMLNARATGSGTAQITVRNVTAGSLGEAIVLRYVVLKSVNA